MVPKPTMKAIVVPREVYREANGFAGLSAGRCGKDAKSKGKKGTSAVI